MSPLRFAVLPVAFVSLFSATAHAQSETDSAPVPPASSSISTSVPSYSPAETPPPDFAPSEPRAERPHHQGFTLELGLGASLVNVARDGNPSKTSFGLAPLSFSLGGFVSHDVALMARVAGASYFKYDAKGNQEQYVNGFYGAHVQYWITDNFMISGGPGVTLFGKNSLIAGPATSPDVGYGASFRVGYAMLATKHHALRISYEAFPSVYDKAFVFGSAINFEWQYF